jgi:4-coumarate--CoA ligase
MKVRGYQVAPAELEGFLLLRPDVVDACVVSIPDDYSGEIPLAFIVLDPDTQKRVRGDQAASIGLKKAIQKVLISNINFCQFDTLIFFD